MSNNSNEGLWIFGIEDDGPHVRGDIQDKHKWQLGLHLLSQTITPLVRATAPKAVGIPLASVTDMADGRPAASYTKVQIAAARARWDELRAAASNIGHVPSGYLILATKWGEDFSE